jgi:hypothetical protein
MNSNQELDNPEKIIQLTGNAAAALNPSTRKRRGRRGGDNSGALVQVAEQAQATSGPLAPGANIFSQVQDAMKQMPLLKGGRRGGDNSGALLQLAATHSQGMLPHVQDAMKQMPLLKGGGTTGAYVNLASTRSVTTVPGDVKPGYSGEKMEQPAPFAGGGKVVLHPHKKSLRVSLRAKKNKHSGGSPSTRKAPRKIRLGVKGIKTRLNRAKKAHAHAQSASLSVVRQRLVRAGVIKANSKAPESMLRSMYADLLVTKKGL